MGIPAWALKAAAIGLVLAATVASADYVGGHVKNQAAPLRPSLQPATGQVNLTPGVRSTSSQPVTESYAS